MPLDSDGPDNNDAENSRDPSDDPDATEPSGRPFDELPETTPASKPSHDLFFSTSWRQAETESDLETIGPYRVEDRIGSGGMGVVYRVRRANLDRDFALKLILPGFRTAHFVDRFASEKDALGKMQHECIAQVFDAGETETGAPYFVMEHVPGSPIHEYCDEKQLSIEERLRLFIDVCHGVQHAHSKSVIHRDLTPRNILVHEHHDGSAKPKIIDFGLAKALLPDGTQEESRLGGGTPGYMSPEQVDQRWSDVDTRSDIYTLGIVLYLLLVGDHPFRSESRPDETPPQVPWKPQKEATRLSSRVRGMDAGVRRQHESKRRLPRGRLQRRVRGDLDWICAKAIESDPKRRYQTVAALAADLTRHLEHRPIEAGAPGTAHRVWKFCRRFPVGVTLAALFVVTVTGLAIVLYDQNLELSKQTFQAITATETARKETKRAEDALEKAEEATRREAKETQKALASAASEKAAKELALSATVAEKKATADAREAEAEEKKAKEEATALVEELRAANVDLTKSQIAQAILIQKQLRAELDAYAESALARRSPRFDGWESALSSIENVVTDYLRLEDGPRVIVDAAAEVAELEQQSQRDREDIERYREEWDHVQSLLAETPRRWLEVVADAATGTDSRVPFQLPSFREIPALRQLACLGKSPAGFWEFSHPASGRSKPTGDDGEEHKIVAGGGVIFVLLWPAGEFIVGAAPKPFLGKDDDRHVYSDIALADEGPHARVPLNHALLVSKYELTRDQWRRLTQDRETPSLLAKHGINGQWGLHPVDGVTWQECKQVLEGLGWRLPTEAEWEYAARGGLTSDWALPSETGAHRERQRLPRFANIADLSLAEEFAFDIGVANWSDGAALHRPVGHECQPNAFGLYDMLGNVWEWCEDRYGLYDRRTGLRGVRESGSSIYRVIRGGSYLSPPDRARPTARGKLLPLAREPMVGVRPVIPLIVETVAELDSQDRDPMPTTQASGL